MIITNPDGSYNYEKMYQSLWDNADEKGRSFLESLRAIQLHSKKLGLDKMTLEENNAEIDAVRTERMRRKMALA